MDTPLRLSTIASRITAATSAHARALETQRLDREARESLRLALWRLALCIGCEVAEVFDMKVSDVMIAKDSEPRPMLTSASALSPLYRVRGRCTVPGTGGALTLLYLAHRDAVVLIVGPISGLELVQELLYPEGA